MSAAQDRKFRDVFGLTIGILAGVVAGIFFVATYVADRGQSRQRLAEPEYRRQVAERTAPVARIAIAGRDNTALAIAPSAPASSQPALPIPTTGTDVFQQVCTTCHGAGIGGAPRAGDAAAWSARLAKGKSTLYQHSLEGFKGEAGVMPPKGGRADIPDELIRAAVDHMTEMSR